LPDGTIRSILAALLSAHAALLKTRDDSYHPAPRSGRRRHDPVARRSDPVTRQRDQVAPRRDALAGAAIPSLDSAFAKPDAEPSQLAPRCHRPMKQSEGPNRELPRFQALSWRGRSSAPPSLEATLDRPLVYGVATTDPAALAGAIAGFALIALSAILVASRGAAGTDPMVILRAD
jgi:hypothetical protein